MRRDDFDDFTARLAAWAADADGVLGLVLLGSTAATTHPPDEWSDHDFFVIAEPSALERLRSGTAWLPARDVAIAVHERDTEHGAWVVYDDGHLLEYAVFTPEQLAGSRSGAHRIAVDRLGDLAERIRPTLAPPPRDPRTIATGMHRALLVGGGRAARGEGLVARRHLVDAVGALLALASLAQPGREPDPQDPWRRVERADPPLAGALDGILARGDAGAALDLARLAERVAGEQPWWPSELAAAVRARLAAMPT
ncbi:MAG: hypothetical protein ACQEWM_02860 [Actinomycetota bacterium]